MWFLVSVCAVQYICERIITPPRKFNPNSEPRDKDCDCSHVDSQTTVEVVYLLIKNKPLRESQYNFTLTLWELGLQMTLKDTATKAILTGLRFCLSPSPSESHLSKA